MLIIPYKGGCINTYMNYFVNIIALCIDMCVKGGIVVTQKTG